jgi:hypothetical protein
MEGVAMNSSMESIRRIVPLWAKGVNCGQNRVFGTIFFLARFFFGATGLLVFKVHGLVCVTDYGLISYGYMGRIILFQEGGQHEFTAQRTYMGPGDVAASRGTGGRAERYSLE